VLSKNDKSVPMSDTAFAQVTIKEAFPEVRHGSVKAAQVAAYRFIRERVEKELTLRRVRSIWEGKAKRIDGEEKDALRVAKIEEAKREREQLRERLSRLDEALAAYDKAFLGATLATAREQVGHAGGTPDRGGEAPAKRGTPL
jgi:hypothetical protein